MKAILHTITTACLLLSACGSNSDNDLVADQPLMDSSAAPVAEVADTTLQPVVALILHATGNTMEELSFVEDTLTAPADALIKLKLINESTAPTMIHNFILATDGKYEEVAKRGEGSGASGKYQPKGEDVYAATPLALPGQTIELEFKAPPPGTYDFVCTYPDHWEQMHGKFIVK